MQEYKAVDKFDPVAKLTWPKQLKTPKELVNALRFRKNFDIIKSPTATKLVLQFIGSWAYLLTHKLNNSHVKNITTFNTELKRIQEQNVFKSSTDGKGRYCPDNADLGKRSPLITLSNHISCIDDPGLWAILLPLNYYYTQAESVRWVGAAVDICFDKPWHSTLFSLGKTFPIIRGAGLKQHAMDYALALLRHHQWLHLFPEGRVMRDEEQRVISNKDRGYTFKWGISRLILDYFKSSSSPSDVRYEHGCELRLLPFYHIGMDHVLPIGRPYIPKIGRCVSIYVRPEVIIMNARLLADILRDQSLGSSRLKSYSNDERAQIKLTNYLEQEMERLIEPAEHFHTIVQNNKRYVKL